MKITQKFDFTPIILTLETSEEAEALWDAIRFATESPNIEFTPASKEILIRISNWFSHSASL